MKDTSITGENGIDQFLQIAQSEIRPCPISIQWIENNVDKIKCKVYRSSDRLLQTCFLMSIE